MKFPIRLVNNDWFADADGRGVPNLNMHEILRRANAFDELLEMVKIANQGYYGEGKGDFDDIIAKYDVPSPENPA